MKRLIYATALLAAAALLLGSGCRKEDDDCFDEGNPRCSNYDPCHGRQTPVSAAFEILMTRRLEGRPDKRYKVSDTLQVGTYEFIADDDGAEYYYWQFGSDPRVFEGRETQLSFDCDAVGQNIMVTLVAERLKDSTCLPLDLLRDTVRKSMYFVPQSVSRLEGKFEGSLSDKSSENFEIEIKLVCDLQSQCFCLSAGPGIYSIYNIDNHGCWQLGSARFLSYAQGGFIDYLNSARTSNGCSIPDGYDYMAAYDMEIELYSKGDSIYIEFERHLGLLPGFQVLKIEKGIVFRGKRVN